MSEWIGWVAAAKGQAEPGIRLGAQAQGWQCGLPCRGRDMNEKCPVPAPWLAWSGQPPWLYCLRHFRQGSQDCLNSSPANQHSGLSAFPQPSGRSEREESPQTSGVHPSTTQGKADPQSQAPSKPPPSVGSPLSIWLSVPVPQLWHQLYLFLVASTLLVCELSLV